MKFNQKLLGILLVFGVIIYSCESNQISNFNINSKGSSEGIKIYINNIPEETVFLSVSLFDITLNDQLYTGTGSCAVSTLFKDNELEKIKNTGFIVCPFVKIGHEYEISVTSFILKEEDLMPVITNTAKTTANGGIYLINDPILTLNNNISILSEKPIFSDDIINEKINGINYGLSFNGGEFNGKVNNGINELTNELIFDNTQNLNSIIGMIENIGLKGNIPIFADVQLSIEYEEIKWTIVFAKTENINISI